jgi:hypothetical protein
MAAPAVNAVTGIEHRLEHRAELWAKVPPWHGAGPKNTSAAATWVHAMRRGPRPADAGGWRDPVMAARVDTRDD